MSETYALATNGIFRTVQGEGYLLGEPMVFIRLAGCSIGCAACDTNYRVFERLGPVEIVRKVAELAGGTVDWVWVTGGEPTDHDLAPLLRELKRLGPNTRLALATAGVKRIPQVFASERWDWLSVSPHDPANWNQDFGSELKLVAGLNGKHLTDFEPCLENKAFCHKYVAPCADMIETIKECEAWVYSHPGWKMTCQAHKLWGIA